MELGVVNKTTVLKKLKSGNRCIFIAYTVHCRYNGEWHKDTRRLMIIAVLFVP